MHRSYLWLGLTLLLWAAGWGCSGADNPGHEFYISGDVTMTDSSTFRLEGQCNVRRDDSTGDILWSIEGVDTDRKFGVLISWKEAFLTNPGTYNANEGLLDLTTWILREHPTEPDQIRMSTVSSGTITFDTIGYGGGDILNGAFDVTLDRDEPDDTVHITIQNGAFHCRVP